MIERVSASGAAASARVSVDDLVSIAGSLPQQGRRAVLGIAGAPGAGKSTLSAALVDALGDRAVVVEMDGFHLADVQLHRLGLRDRKGAPETFDLDGFRALLRRVHVEADRPIYAPRFDRRLEEPIAGAIVIPPSVDVVIVEGNYVLLDEPGWRELAADFDETWYLSIDDEIRNRRLVARRQGFGETASAAEAWVHGVDDANAARVLPSRARADRIIEVATDLTGNHRNSSRSTR